MNKDDSELIFTQLQNEIMQFKHQGEILICGDFNARTGGLQDYIQNDDGNENFIDCPVPINYSPDIPLHFIVRSPVELSDHCLLSVCFKSCTQRETTLESLSDVGKFQWEHSMSDNYHDALLHKESVNDILDLMNNIDDENCDDIDFLVSSVNKIYVNAASQTLVLKKKSSRPSNKRKRAKPKKAWMSNDCLLLRKEVRSLGKRLQKDKNNANLRQTYSNCVKHYNKQKKSLKAEFYRTFISKLNSLEHKDSKSFWKSINDLKNNHQQAPSPLSKQEWVEHYKSLLNSDSELNFPDDLETSKDNHCSLDYPFTCNEVKKGITRLKSETPNGLQHCVDALQSFCIDWGLNVNTKKTQTMILSNSKNRSLLDKHYFYFGPQPLESATEYKYLGIVFNNRGKLNIAAENLADKARKAYFALKSKLPYSNCIAVEKWVRLFNSLISPIMTYGSEIWISDFNINLDTADKLPFEKVQNMIMKNVLGVHGLIRFKNASCETDSAPGYMIFSSMFMPSICFAQMAYGATILSFLGGVRWGFSISEESVLRPGWISLGVSVIPSLVAWGGLMMPHPLSLFVVMGGLAGAGYYDMVTWGYPPWFKGLRFILTFVAILALWTTFMCSYLLKSESNNESKYVNTTE
ncbi:unnamed protein product [Mytilus edulis]|uniref:Endonuclease/exonuclease/phosphatase domain-containing protein n=1 Tax=Mytilus edulis TaxID=6550 RepID=A0A8S3U5F0_MYTED|nr:unnamed protein product [Mytilus edulis]